MGAGASLDASSVLTKEEAKAIAGDQWDEAKWEAAEKDEAGAVRAELLIAHIAAATVARPDEFSGLGEEARKRAAKTRAKELKAEISKWSEDFEENQGRKPSEEDKVAIKDKVDLFKHYKAMYQAKAPHGDDSKQPAAKVSSVKPSDDESSPRPALVPTTDEFSGLGEEARKRAAKTRAKELKAEISKWSEDFEENQGRKPSEEDKVAIKDKVDLFKHYKAMYQAKAPHGDDSKQPAAKVSSVKPSDDESSPRPARADAGAASARALTSPHAIQASPDASMMEVREEINADADAPEAVAYPDPDPDPDPDARTALVDYADKASLLRVARQGYVQLVSPQLFIDCHEEGRPLPRCQDVASEYVLGARPLADERTEIIAVSYCWISPQHPDPDGYHVETLCHMLRKFLSGRYDESEREMDYHMPESEIVPTAWWLRDQGFSFGAGDGRPVAVFFDYVSLPQTPRSQDDDIVMDKGLQNINVWYAHAHTTTWMLTSLPPGTMRKSYDSSGWTCFEWCIGGVVSSQDKLLRIDEVAREELVSGAWNDEEFDYLQVALVTMDARGPPLTPDDFARIVQGKVFTNKADCEKIVIPKYRATFDDVIVGAQQLNYAGLRFRDEDAQLLLYVASQFCQRGKLKHLNLCSNNIQGTLLDTFAVFAADWRLETLELGSNSSMPGELSSLEHLSCLTKLNLYWTSVSGDLSSLAELTNLTDLNLSRNGEGLTGNIFSLKKLENLELLSIHSCRQITGDISCLRGMTRLTKINFGGSFQIEGDIGSCEYMLGLVELDVEYCERVWGQLSSLVNLTSLERLRIDRTGIAAEDL